MSSPDAAPPHSAAEAPLAAPLLLAVGLHDVGWHPAAWREPGAAADGLFSLARWSAQVQEAERGDVDLVTLDDGPGLQTEGDAPVGTPRTDRVRGRLDAMLLAAALAPASTRVGLVPASPTTLTEPFHVSTQVATLDVVARGRAGWLAMVAAEAEAMALVGWDAPVPTPTADVERAEAPLLEEAAEHVAVVRALWDSWEDGAEIRDVATNRFVDRDRLHHVHHEGPLLHVRGPSITPRPPQGQPVVVVHGHTPTQRRFAARAADAVLVAPADGPGAAGLVAEVRTAEVEAGREGPPLRVLADLEVLLDEEHPTAVARRRRLDEAAGRHPAADGAPLATPDGTASFTGTPEQLAELLGDWSAAGVDGVRLLPAAVPHDLEQIARRLVPELRALHLRPPAPAPGAAGDPGQAPSLRERLGLARPASRYAETAR